MKVEVFMVWQGNECEGKGEVGKRSNDERESTLSRNSVVSTQLEKKKTQTKQKQPATKAKKTKGEEKAENRGEEASTPARATTRTHKANQTNERQHRQGREVVLMTQRKRANHRGP